MIETRELEFVCVKVPTSSEDSGNAVAFNLKDKAPNGSRWGLWCSLEETDEELVMMARDLGEAMLLPLMLKFIRDNNDQSTAVR